MGGSQNDDLQSMLAARLVCARKKQRFQKKQTKAAIASHPASGGKVMYGKGIKEDCGQA